MKRVITARSGMLGLIVFCILAADTKSQTLPDLSTFVGTFAARNISARNAGDIDGDGCEDYFINFFRLNPAGGGFPPIYDAVVVSGKTGALLADYRNATFPPIPVSSLHRLGDLSFDGRAEYLSVERPSAMGMPFVLRVHDGTSHNPNFSFNRAAVTEVEINDSANLGDLDGDGVAEFGFAERSRINASTENGRFEIRNGLTGAVIRMQQSTVRRARSIGSVGDIDGDGVPDYFFADAPNLNSAIAGAGKVEVYSGATHSPLHTFTNVNPFAVQGWGASAHEDLDGDGQADLVILSMGSNTPLGNVPSVLTELSMGTGASAWTVMSAPGELFNDLLEIGDVNGDGVRDYEVNVVNDTFAVNLFIERRIYSGANGSVIETISSQPIISNPSTLQGTYRIGDLNGDHISDALIGALDVTGGFIVSAVGRATLGAQNYGAVTGNLTLNYSPSRPQPNLGGLILDGASPFATLRIGVSARPANTTIFGTPFPLFISVAPEDLILTDMTIADGLGRFFTPVSLRVPALAELVVYIQMAEIGSNPGTSNGVELLFSH